MWPKKSNDIKQEVEGKLQRKLQNKAAVGYTIYGEIGISNWQTIAPPQMIVQLSTERIQSTAANRRMSCHALSGRLLGHVDVSLSIRPHQLLHQVAVSLGMSQQIVNLKLILPDGKLLHMSDTIEMI